MYKNYEDKLNTILSNAKGEKVEKVDLAIQDYDKFETRLKNLNKNLKSDADEVISSFEKIRIKRTIIRKISLELGKIISEAEKQRDKDVKAAKQLGVDANIFIKKLRELYNLQNNGNEIINRMNRFTK